MCQFRDIHSSCLFRKTPVYRYQQYFSILSSSNSTTRVLRPDKIRFTRVQSQTCPSFNINGPEASMVPASSSYSFSVCLFQGITSFFPYVDVCSSNTPFRFTQSGRINDLVTNFQKTNRISPLHIKVGTLMAAIA